MNSILLNEMYSGEGIAGYEEDIRYAIEDQMDIPKDKYGFIKGQFNIVVTYIPDAE